MSDELEFDARNKNAQAGEKLPNKMVQEGFVTETSVEGNIMEETVSCRRLTRTTEEGSESGGGESDNSL